MTRRRWRFWRHRLLIGFAALVLVASATAAAGAVSDHGRRLAGPFCIDKNDGTVHARAATKPCAKDQVSKAGLAAPAVPGPPGAKGDTGPPGPAGPAGQVPQSLLDRVTHLETAVVTLNQTIDVLENRLDQLSHHALKVCAGDHYALLTGEDACRGKQVYLLVISP